MLMLWRLCVTTALHVMTRVESSTVPIASYRTRFTGVGYVWGNPTEVHTKHTDPSLQCISWQFYQVLLQSASHYQSPESSLVIDTAGKRPIVIGNITYPCIKLLSMQVPSINT